MKTSKARLRSAQASTSSASPMAPDGLASRENKPSDSGPCSHRMSGPPAGGWCTAHSEAQVSTTAMMIPAVT